jgi:UDP-3-O-[3-hydroxymyristoyl] glucosamine N-acyltransferase
MNPSNLIEGRTSDGGLGRAAQHATAEPASARRKPPKGLSLGELAGRFGCTVQGDANVRVTHVSTLQDADEQAITFVANPKYLPDLADTHAGAVILSAQYAAQSPVPALIARNPYATYARVASVLHPVPAAPSGVHSSAVIERDVRLGAGVSIGAGCVIEEGASLGTNVVLGPQCVVMRNARIGANTRLVARVTVCADVSIGERCILHPGAIIGSDGFGNAPDNSAWVKIPQLGSVQVGNDVEIGANTTIDRPAVGETRIRAGAKIDNLVQVAHGVSIGERTLFAAQVGIAGSTVVEPDVVLAGQVGVAGHLRIGKGVIATAQTGIPNSIDAGTMVSGYPAIPNREWLKSSAIFRNLPALKKRVAELEQRIAELEEKLPACRRPSEE